MKYMVCLDGSEPSKNALQLALRVVRPEQDSLLLFSTAYTGYDIPNEEVEVYEHSQLKHSTLIVEEAEKVALAAGVKNVSHKAVLGFPRDQILLAADDEEIDVIVVGARGLSPIKKLLLGSVSSYVVSHSTCAVLVAKTKELMESA